jgi:Spy/CpxP family protein refolding chaperone
MSTPSFPRRRKLTLAVGAGAVGLALAAFFAANLAANTPETPNAPAEPWAIRHAAKRLGLSDDQKEQIRGVLKAHAGEIEAQMQAAQTGNKALREAMSVQPLDEAKIRQQALALGGVRADGAVLRARIRSEIWPILTPDQQEKAKEMRSMKGQWQKRRMENLERWIDGGA